jgi:gamma-glutamylputrescine oxidase
MASARAVELRGGTIVSRARVVAIEPGATPSLRVASGRTLRADIVILATASESTSLSKLTGRIIPIKLKVVATRPLTPEHLAALGWKNRECIVDTRRLFNYFRLTSDQRIVFGGGTPLYGSMSRSSTSFDDLLHELRRTFPNGESLRIGETWCGTIDYTLDGLPVIGPLRSAVT